MAPMQGPSTIAAGAARLELAEGYAFGLVAAAAAAGALELDHCHPDK